MLSKRNYLLIFILLILFTGVVYYFGFNYKEKKLTLIVDPSFKATYNGKKWKHIDTKLSITEKNFEVYDYNGYLGKYNLSYLKNKDRWLVYKSDMTEKEKIGDIVAYKSDFETKYFDVKKEDILLKDKQTIDKILKHNKIYMNSDNAFNIKYTIDLNGDKKKDTLIISNLFSDSNKAHDAYCMVVAVINNKEYSLYFDYLENDIRYIIPSMKLDAIFDFENDGKKEIVLTSSRFGNSKVCVKVYGITKEGPKQLVSLF